MDGREEDERVGEKSDSQGWFIRCAQGIQAGQIPVGKQYQGLRNFGSWEIMIQEIVDGAIGQTGTNATAS